MTNSVEWICEYRNCDVKFIRLNCYVKRNTKRFCCQSHASLENQLIIKENGGRKYIERTFICILCNTEIQAFTAHKKYCDECHRIMGIIRRLQREYPNLQNFTITDYYKVLKLQNGKCGICNVARCSTGHKFAIDHNHETGQVRGLLCLGCNTKLGWYEKNMISADKYLEKYN
jgi:hypothetical protein